MTDIKKDLTNSAVDRQNILNNPYAVQEIEKAAGVKGFTFKGKAVVLKEQVAAFFEVTPRTIDNYLEKYGEELRQNGYEVIRGKPLQELKILISENDVNETDFVDIKKAPQIGVFDFRSFLNLPNRKKINVEIRTYFCHCTSIKGAAPLQVSLESVIRRLFFCSDASLVNCLAGGCL